MNIATALIKKVGKKVLRSNTLLFFDVKVDVLNKTRFLLQVRMMNQQKKDSRKTDRETSAQTNPVSATAGFLLSPSDGEKIWIVGDTGYIC